MHYYNEIDPYAAQWLRNLMAAGHLPRGDIDTRSITEVSPDDLRGYTQCHFFAGIGGWPLALRMAGWDDTRPVWTGSCPCQPFSAAGKQAGQDDARHLWPTWKNLIAKRRPATVFGEQVASAITHGWLDEVATDLEAEAYAFAAAILPACAAGAFHRRDRLWFVADAESERRHRRAVAAQPSGRAFAEDRGSSPLGDTHVFGPQGSSDECLDTQGRKIPGRPAGLPDGDLAWLQFPDGKARPVKPGIRLLAHGIPDRVGKLRAYGNAIYPQAAAAFVTAFDECSDLVSRCQKLSTVVNYQSAEIAIFHGLF